MTERSAATVASQVTGGERPETNGAGELREEVLVLDFGGQYSQLIARRIRECGVFSELLPHDIPIERIRERSVLEARERPRTKPGADLQPSRQVGVGGRGRLVI